MNLQDLTFPIELSIPEAESILKGLAHLPKMEADPIFTKVQQTALAKIQEVQTQGATNPQVQDEINQAEANSDSMKGE
jgi:hypothetical protein